MERKQINIDFFRIKLSSNLQKFEDFLNEVNLLPNEKDKVQEIYKVPIRLQRLSNNNGTWEGEIIRIRMNTLPSIASFSGEVNSIDLDDDEGLGERTAFLYHAKSRILLLEKTRSGVSSASFAKYFQSFVTNGQITIRPIIEATAMQQIENMKYIKKYEISIASLDKLEIFEGVTENVAQTLDIAKKLKSPNLHLTMSVGHEKKSSLDAATIIANVKSWLKIKGTSQDQENVFRRIDITGSENEEDSSDVVEVLGRTMRETGYAKVDNRELSYEAKRLALQKAWAKREDDLRSMFNIE